MEESERSCLICVTGKPSRERRSSGNSKELEFKNAFSVFCKLLNVDQFESKFDSLCKFAFEQQTFFEDNRGSGPCCRDCFSDFQDILRLQRVIDETLIVQRKLAERLKRGLLQSSDEGFSYENNIWSKLRIQLICCLKEEFALPSEEFVPAPKVIGRNRSDGSSRRRKQKFDNLRVSDVEVEDDFQFNYSDPLQDDDVQMPDQEENEAEEIARKLIPKDKSPLKKARAVAVEEEAISTEKLRLIQPCSVVINKLNQSQSGVKIRQIATKSTSGINKLSRKSKLKAYRVIRSVVKTHIPKSQTDKYLVEDDDDMSDAPDQDYSDDNYIPENELDENENSDNDGTNTNGSEDEVDENASDSESKNEAMESRLAPRREKIAIRKKLGEAKNISHGFGKQHRNRTNRFFYVINENTLLCRGTLVDFSITGLKCQEENCSVAFEGQDLDSFLNMLKHIEHAHETSRSYYEGIRVCPLCNAQYLSAPEFRHHLLQEHVDTDSKSKAKKNHYQQVICEVCLKVYRACNINAHYKLTHPKEFSIWEVVEQERVKVNKRARLGVPVNKRTKVNNPETENVLKAKLADQFLEAARKIRASKSKTANTTDAESDKGEAGDGYESNSNSSAKTKSKVGRNSNGGRRNATSRYFYKVNKNLLLCRMTLVDWSSRNEITNENKILKCLEPNCNTEIEGIDFRAFVKMLIHIEDEHEPKYCTDTTLRECPYAKCNAEFKFAQDFRRHLMRTHVVKKRHVCEVCQMVNIYIASHNAHYSACHPKELAIWETKWEERRLAKRKFGVNLGNVESFFEDEEEAEIENSANTTVQVGNVGIGDSDSDSNHNEDNPQDQDYDENEEEKGDISKAVTSASASYQLRTRSLTPSRKANSNREEEAGTSTDTEVCRKNRTTAYFYVINEQFLLCRITLVDYSSPEELKCMEPDCSVIIPRRNGANGESPFELMLDHIEENHELEYSVDEKLRECPKCKKEFYRAPNFRYHLLKEHDRIWQVFCEVCHEIQSGSSGAKKHYLESHPEEFPKWDKRIKRGSAIKERIYLGNLKKRSMKKDLLRLKVLEKIRALKEKDDPCPTTSKTNTKTTTEIVVKGLDSYFHVITENILCWSATFIKLTETSMLCQSPGCSFQVEGNEKDKDKLYSMRKHIALYHKIGSSSKAILICPLCPEEFKVAAGRKFLEHLANFHNSEENLVLCEFCGDKYPNSKISSHFNTSHKDEHPSSLSARQCTIEIVQEERKRRELDLFYVFGESENWILHKFTLIQRSPISLTCMEQDCNFVTASADYFAYEEFKTHVKIEHGGGPRRYLKSYPDLGKTCPECNKHYKCGSFLRNHILIDHKSKWICQSCGKLGVSGGYRRHCWLHFNEEERAAQIAQGEPDPSAVAKERVMNTEERYKCGSCDKRFKNRAGKAAHEQTHLPRHLRKIYKCPEENCNMEVLSRPALRSHIERQHKPELATRPRVCNICLRRFHFRDGHAYRQHMKSHRGIKDNPFFCDQCGKAFRSNYALKKHVQGVHAKLRYYQCEFCEMAYKHSGNLKRHRETAHKDMVEQKPVEERLRHTLPEFRPDFIGPKLMYPCSYCEKPFALHSRTRKHEKICVRSGGDRGGSRRRSRGKKKVEVESESDTCSSTGFEQEEVSLDLGEQSVQDFKDEDEEMSFRLELV